MRILMAVVAALLLSACAVNLVSPYDEAIEKGILEYQEQFNNLVKNAGDLAGKPEGTYESSVKGYNALETKIDILIQRASTAAEGKGCKLEAKLQAKIAQVLKDGIPAPLRPEAQVPDGNPGGCNTRLLELVKQQLEIVRRIHSTTDKCGTPTGDVSCLRKPSSVDAARAANQSIYAVYIVETAKK